MKSINMVDLASLIDCGAAKAAAVERLLEPGNEEALLAYILQAKRRRNKMLVTSCNTEFEKDQAEITSDFKKEQIGRRAVFAICKESPNKALAKKRLEDVAQFFKDYGLTAQANGAWKEYWA